MDLLFTQISIHKKLTKSFIHETGFDIFNDYICFTQMFCPSDVNQFLSFTHEQHVRCRVGSTSASQSNYPDSSVYCLATEWMDVKKITALILELHLVVDIDSSSFRILICNCSIQLVFIQVFQSPLLANQSKYYSLLLF